uniref:Uncharacterized protein n=1 Tax=Romanomermis culicivorax TaxID=13658 RepID=A0A915HEC8_ROMCU
MAENLLKLIAISNLNDQRQDPKKLGIPPRPPSQLVEPLRGTNLRQISLMVSCSEFNVTRHFCKNVQYIKRANLTGHK